MPEAAIGATGRLWAANHLRAAARRTLVRFPLVAGFVNKLTFSDFSSIEGSRMAREKNTFEKNRREMEKKRKAEDKRKKRDQKKGQAVQPDAVDAEHPAD